MNEEREREYGVYLTMFVVRTSDSDRDWTEGTAKGSH